MHHGIMLYRVILSGQLLPTGQLFCRILTLLLLHRLPHLPLIPQVCRVFDVTPSQLMA
jgi:hypothetical protein